MLRTLIAYSTVDGHTVKICDRVRRVLEQTGCSVVMLDIDSEQVIDLAYFEVVVIGASVRYGKHRPNVYGFIQTHRDELDRRHTAFFSVNVVARKAGKDTPEANPYMRAFRRRTNWVPGEVAVFAGKIDYPRYGFLDRQMIRLIMWLTHGPTDPATCTEFTDWQAVDRFAQRVARTCQPSAP